MRPERVVCGEWIVGCMGRRILIVTNDHLRAVLKLQTKSLLFVRKPWFVGHGLNANLRMRDGTSED